MSHNPIIYTIANQKGVIDKITTTFNLGYTLSTKGKRVLLIDFDHSQGNSSMVTLCNSDAPKEYTAEEIKQIRNRLNMSRGFSLMSSEYRKKQ